ncbi:MAG TPA: Fur family transcriptional regulator [Ktedonobacterales bacterium]|nr:Fur family transcriptional regulator [Ktedonobacterales bacterium]
MAEDATVSAAQMVAALEAAGLRPTRPRGALIAQIAEWALADKDFTSEELWHAAQQRAPWIGRSTAFRTVELLAEFGFLDRVTFADGSERYHAVQPGTHHHHLTCEQCHRVVDIDTCLPAEILEGVAQESGFALSGHRLELFGRCPDCQQSSPTQTISQEPACQD